MKTTLNINGENVEITLTKEQVEAIKKQTEKSPMDEVYAYHNTTEKEFEEQYKNVSEFAKHQEIERMIVNFYNKGVVPDINNHLQYKWFIWWYLGDNFRLDGVHYRLSSSNVSARLCFLRQKDALEASEKFFEQFKNSRNN